MANQLVVVLCTAPNADAAGVLARGLVDARLAACVNVTGPVRSVYRWKGEVQTDQEVQLLIKAPAGRFDEVAAWIRAHHPYEVPEILALDVRVGDRAYLAWAAEQTSPAQG